MKISDYYNCKLFNKKNLHCESSSGGKCLRLIPNQIKCIPEEGLAKQKDFINLLFRPDNPKEALRIYQ